MPTTKKKKTARRKPSPPRTLKAERLSQLREDFAHFDNFREDAERRFAAATSAERSFLADVLRLLDLAADAAERVEGFSLNAEADEATGELAAFLR